MPDGLKDRPPAEATNAATQADRDAAYDAWFRAQVEEAVRVADDPNTVWSTHEDVARRGKERIRRWFERTARSA
jgi:hypothetical protein